MKNSLIGFFIGLAVALSFTLFAGENPIHIGWILTKSAFGSPYDLGLTLYYTAGLIFTGLSVSVAFKAGLFNIGAEGQLLIGSLCATVAGLLFPNLPFPISVCVATLAAILGGGLWALFPAWLKIYRGSHEVIVTMMMNLIAAGLTSWVILKVIPNPDSQNPESALLSANYIFTNDPIKKILGDSPASWALVIALLCSFLVWYFFEKTKWGYQVQVTGANPFAADRAGQPTKKLQLISFFISGALAGGVALVEILGNSGQFKIGFSPDFGFIGIAVALMARNNPLGLVVSAFLMGALHKGASDLDFETTTITRDFSKIIQGTVILFISVQGYAWFKRKKGSK